MIVTTAEDAIPAAPALDRSEGFGEQLLGAWLLPVLLPVSASPFRPLRGMMEPHSAPGFIRTLCSLAASSHRTAAGKQSRKQSRMTRPTADTELASPSLQTEPPVSDPNPGRGETGRQRPTRLSSLHTGLVIASVALILLVIFLVQNARSVKISFLGANAHVSLAIALLIAALGGAVIVGGVGAARITQLRRHRGKARARDRT